MPDNGEVDLSDWLALIAIVVGLVAIGVGAWAARRYGTRRRKVVFEWSASPLIPVSQGDGPSLLAVTYRDFEVSDPYLLSLSLINVGPADVASEHFDGGRELVIDLGCKLYGLLRRPVGDNSLRTVSGAIGSDGVLSLRPGLLRRGSEWSAEVVVSGQPRPTLTSSLVDTDVLDPPTYRAQLAGNTVLRALRPVARLTPFGGLLLSATDTMLTLAADRARRGTLGNG